MCGRLFHADDQVFLAVFPLVNLQHRRGPLGRIPTFWRSVDFRPSCRLQSCGCCWTLTRPAPIFAGSMTRTHWLCFVVHPRVWCRSNVVHSRLHLCSTPYPPATEAYMDRDKLPLQLNLFPEASLASKRKYGMFAQFCSVDTHFMTWHLGPQRKASSGSTAPALGSDPRPPQP